MAEPVRHRQTKEAATDMFDLQPPRHIPTLPFALILACPRHVRLGGNLGHDAAVQLIDTSVVRVLQARRAGAAAERQKNLEFSAPPVERLGLLICPSGRFLDRAVESYF
jgi:hypothetical protein